MYRRGMIQLSELTLDPELPLHCHEEQLKKTISETVLTQAFKVAYGARPPSDAVSVQVPPSPHLARWTLQCGARAV